MFASRTAKTVLSLTRAFSRVSLSSPRVVPPQLLLGAENPSPQPQPTPQPTINFLPSSISLEIVNPRPVRNEIRDFPISNKIIENPKPILNEISEQPGTERTLDLPNIPNRNVDQSGYQAVTMIVIRRRKMRIHKLKKRRRKYKQQNAKMRTRRELKKEKAFQEELLTQIRKGEEFNAEEYVNEKIRLATVKPLPTVWNGGRKPEFLIRKLMAEHQEKKKITIERLKRNEARKDWYLY